MLMNHGRPDFLQRRVISRDDLDRPLDWLQTLALRDLILDVRNDLFRFLGPAVSHQPPGALRNMLPQKENHGPDRCTHAKGQAPAYARRQQVAIQ